MPNGYRGKVLACLAIDVIDRGTGSVQCYMSCLIDAAVGRSVRGHDRQEQTCVPHGIQTYYWSLDTGNNLPVPYTAATRTC
jgi:hypothetical protein